MERMGHDTMRAALIYQHATRDADSRIADALAQHINGSTRATTPKVRTLRSPHLAHAERTTHDPHRPGDSA
jgi:hypothetical protein